MPKRMLLAFRFGRRLDIIRHVITQLSRRHQRTSFVTVRLLLPPLEDNSATESAEQAEGEGEGEESDQLGQGEGEDVQES
mmetsp:Transcript_27094/g.54515  ORF Transcript_27094/g.54515 Transcript_27094/m.54515 type:complete len:80 (-) Transcript_27094:303-542(-)